MAHLVGGLLDQPRPMDDARRLRADAVGAAIDADRAAAIHTNGVAPADLSEVQRLRARVAELEEEREILKKASAWFAQEATRTPPKRSGS